MSTRLLQGDCRDVLPTLPSDSFDCVVTSPPYWGLRDYGTAQWEGGDAGCDHRHETAHQAQGSTSARAGRSNAESQRNENFRETCGKCGARRIDRQIGLEPTLDAYVETMVGVFREVRRVLKPEGTCWLNLGDSYTSGGRSTYRSGASDNKGHQVQDDQARPQTPTGLKPKDLCGVPWRVAFALQADGWWLRSAIVWAKPNPMPESVTDRPTSAYEMVFLLTKAERYFYDAEAIKEDGVSNRPDMATKGVRTGLAYLQQGPVASNSVKPDKQRGHGRRHAGFNDRWDAMEKSEQCSGTRNSRNVWTIATQPFKGSHFATMPPDLAERCIKAGCPQSGHVLDPFGGAGTTGLVADRLGRDATLIDLGYHEMAKDRIIGDAPLFADIRAS